METILDTKLVLHIPHFAWEDGTLVPIDHLLFNRKLYAVLQEIGVDSWYVTKAQGFYKGRDYEEELLTVFCHGKDADAIADRFCMGFLENRDLMQQEAFAYERNGQLVIVELDATPKNE